MRRVIACLAAATSLVVSGCGARSRSDGSGSRVADRFLARYVTGDGRVLRHDQGGDIVSEGQAYGMLIAEIANRPSTARTIWSWTDAHLRRSDGLLISHANGSGGVEDQQPATDADTLAAYALLRYTGPDEDTLHDAGRRLADAVLDGESTTLAGDSVLAGDPVLVAAPWALAMSPPVVNPSYWMPAVFAALGRFTGDDRWRQAAMAAVSLLVQLTGNGRSLPTDWARLSNGRATPIPDPDGSAPIRYGLDAARLPVWLGTACTGDARRLAAHWWTILSGENRASDLALSTNGAMIDQDSNPLPLLAAAAAARAAGDTAASRALQARAAQQSTRRTTYYGDAWLALGSALLDRTLDPCREAADG